MRKLSVSWASSRFDRTMQHKLVEWPVLKAKLSAPTVSPEPLSEYLSWDRERQTEAKDQGYWIGGAFRNDLRHNAEVLTRSTITLDIDNAGVGWRERLDQAFGGWAYFFHTTRKHRPEAPRLRVVLPLAEDCTSGEEYEALARLMAERYDLGLVDRVSFVPAQMCFWPTRSVDQEFLTGGSDSGARLSPRDYLDRHLIDWTDRAEWPRTPDEPPPELRAREAANPLGKPGIIGAFCRAYPVTRCLEELLPGVYEPAGDDGRRWRYHASEGAGGAIVYDNDTALYSHHSNNDPGSGRSLNAFDLVRLHRFGERDKQAADAGLDLEGLRPTELPSFRGMQEFAMSLPEVVGELTAVEAFEDLGKGEGPETLSGPSNIIQCSTAASHLLDAFAGSHDLPPVGDGKFNSPDGSTKSTPTEQNLTSPQPTNGTVYKKDPSGEGSRGPAGGSPVEARGGASEGNPGAVALRYPESNQAGPAPGFERPAVTQKNLTPAAVLSASGATQAALSRARLRAAVADCEDADRLVDSVVPQIVGAAVGALEEARLLEEVADRHQELTGRRLSLMALRAQAKDLRRAMRGSGGAGRGEEEQGALAEAMALEGVVLGPEGAVVQTLDNMIRCLRAGAQAGGYAVAYDTFLQTEVLREAAGQGWRPWKDTDYTRLRLALEAIGFTVFGGGNELVRQAVALIAEGNTFDSAQEWLRGLLWDGVPRVRGFASRYLGAPDSDYAQGLSAYLWTELPGRVLVPGEKADMMVVLYGPQGAGKSRVVAALAPGPEQAGKLHFSESDGDKARKIQGKLVVEVDELRGMATSDEDAIKSFLSAESDTWIPKYRERAVTAMRRCTFVGTTDKQEFLSDLAGNRRYLPLSVGQIDLAAIRRDLEQLWAEGAELFLKGGVAHAVERLAGEAHAAHQRGDAWDDLVREWLDQPVGVDDRFEGDGAGLTNRQTLVRLDQALSGAVKMAPDRINRAAEQRMAGCLQREGLKRGFKWVDGKSRRGWVSP